MHSASYSAQEYSQEVNTPKASFGEACGLPQVCLAWVDLRCKPRSGEHLDGLVELRKEAQTPAADRSLLPRLLSCPHRGHTRLLHRDLQHKVYN